MQETKNQECGQKGTTPECCGPKQTENESCTEKPQSCAPSEKKSCSGSHSK